MSQKSLKSTCNSIKPHTKFLDRTRSERYKYPTHFDQKDQPKEKDKRTKEKKQIGPGAKEATGAGKPAKSSENF